MPTSLVEALAVIRPHLPLTFFDNQRLAALKSWGLGAPPVAWAGFECPLGEAERWVDFHQGFKRADLPHLTRWLENRALVENADLAWIAPLLEFCREWARDGSPFFEAVPDLIFEYDVRDHPEQISSPSLFVALERDERDEPNASAIPPATKAAAIEAVLALFMDPARVPVLMRGIAKCLSSAPKNASISHLGLMLARTQAAVRINVCRLRFDQFSSYLHAIGWKGSTDGLDELLADMFANAERINLCIDVGEQVAIPIGLECSTYRRNNQLRWNRLLAHLVERSACTIEQQECLQNWWGRETPVTAPAPWPSNLVLEGLLGKPERFGVIDRYLSHIKVTWQPGASLKFKSYLGFAHRFAKQPGASQISFDAPGTKASPLRSQSAHQTKDLDSAISAGIDFLLGSQLSSGLWQDFPGNGADDPWILLFGASDEWVSAYVAAALGAFEREDAKRAAIWVWRLLNHRRHRGEGWGFSCISPTDADSTVWGLRLANVVGASGSAHATAAGDFLRQHQGLDGGVSTYVREAAIRLFADLPPSLINAWCQPHACVTAAAANLPEFRDDCLRYLRTAQNEDGRWDSYWWTDSEYSTGLAAAAFAKSEDPGDRARLDAALRWTISRIGEDGGGFSAGCKTEAPFATAWSLRTLMAAPEHEQARELANRALQWLLREQRADGSWCGSAWMRTPPVHVSNPDASAESILALDRNANFTTATVLTSLGLARGI